MREKTAIPGRRSVTGHLRRQTGGSGKFIMTATAPIMIWKGSFEMTDQRESRALVIVSILVAFGLGIVLGALADRVPKRYLPAPRVALAPGAPDAVTASAGSASATSNALPDALPDSIPGDGSHDAPADFPIKGNERSGIYHVPGGFAYDRTVATILFRNAAAAERAGFRASKA